jgi:predicted dehydrogenase
MVAVTAQVARHAGQCSWHGLLEFAHGGRGHFELTCKACGDWFENYIVCGETGSLDVQISLPFFQRPAQARAFDGRTQHWSQPLGGHSNAYANQLDAFARSVLHDEPTNPDAVEGLAAVRMLEAVEASVSSGKRVEVARG